MLFPYKYINHPIEKFQRYSDFIFLEVWYNAKGNFNSDKFRYNTELKKIFKSLENEDSKSAKNFVRSIKLIYNEFKILSKEDRKKLKRWYKTNNNISRLCNTRQASPILYNNLSSAFPFLGPLLKDFYTSLYGKKSPFNLASFGNLKKLLKVHYKEFVSLNNEDICPFCGLGNIKGNFHSMRESYDHYLSKGKHPFNSINFKNLAPACNDCNSYYKKEKEPLFSIRGKGKQKIKSPRKSFYIYNEKLPQLNFQILINTSDINNISSNNIVLNITTTNRYSHLDEIVSWIETFGIEERYSAMLCSKKRGAPRWNRRINELKNFQEQTNNPEATTVDVCEYIIREESADLLNKGAFLKVAFLKEWKNQLSN